MISLISLLFSFLTVLIVTPFLMKFFLRAGIVGIDQHKKDKPILPTAGGICVAAGLLVGLLAYIGLNTFLFKSSPDILYLLAIISSILIVTLVGLLDDLNVTSKKFFSKNEKDIRAGLPQWLKPLLTLPAAIPLMVVSAGESVIGLPFIGSVDFGTLYPLILIPLGVVGASNVINMLGGFNGVEAGMGFIYMITLGLFALLTQNNIAILFLIASSSLIAFLFFNWFPAKILPGDSLTYLLGAVIASGVIVGNMEKLGVILILPFFIEFFLKLRAKFKASSLGKLKPDGTLEPPYGKKIYSVTHMIMNLKPMTEKQVALSLILLQIIVSSIGFYLVYFKYI